MPCLRQVRAEEDATPHPTPTNPRRERRCASTPRRGVPCHALAVAALSAVLLVAVSSPAFADSASSPSLNGVIDNLRNWIVGILAGVATLFLTVGGLRYLTAGGDPGQVEKAKTALKSALVGYALAILAPLLVSILASIVGG
jgi:Type IV secretion system pilin